VRLAALAGAVAPRAADSVSAGGEAPAARFFDADGGWFDVSGFLDTAYGFVPLDAPITVPAVGYGTVGALVSVDRDAPGKGERYPRPDIAAIGGLATENKTRDFFGGHLGTWLDGRLRTLRRIAVVADSTLLALAPKIGSHFVSAELRTFEVDSCAAALAWIEGGSQT
jgi:hypothetical protein